jgi:hypothetical protein
MWVGYVATAGTEVTHAEINGKTVPVSVYHEQGLPMFRLDLELPRGRAVTLVLQLREPKVNGSCVVWHQPGVQPLHATVTGDGCG